MCFYSCSYACGLRRLAMVGMHSLAMVGMHTRLRIKVNFYFPLYVHLASSDRRAYKELGSPATPSADKTDPVFAQKEWRLQMQNVRLGTAWAHTHEPLPANKCLKTDRA